MKPLKIIFAGTPTFAIPPLLALLNSEHSVIIVYTQPDRPAGRGRHLTASPVKEEALAHSIPIRQPVTLRDPEEQAFLKSLEPDLMVVAAYGLILPKSVLTIPRLGCVNIHASLLPRWRGAAPIQHAILAGDEVTGITIMQMDAGLDTGPMLHQLSCPIYPDDTTQQLLDRLASLGATALMEVLPDIQNGSLKPEPQNNELARLAPKIEKEQAAIDWKEEAIQIERKIRAFNPWPIAFTTLDHQIIRIWEAKSLHQATTATPGAILAVDKQGIDVATGKETLRLLKLQLPGGKPLDIADILNARKNLFTVGTQFHKAMGKV